MCEQLGVEPDPKRLPPTLDIFPEEVQYSFIIFNLMPDRWDGMSGGYFGKDWSSIDFFLNLYNIHKDRKVVVFFISHIQNFYVKKINEKIEQKRKAEERKAKAGGKQYVHNVKG